MALQRVPGLYESFSLADVVRNVQQQKILKQQLQQGEIKMKAFETAEAAKQAELERKQKILDIMTPRGVSAATDTIGDVETGAATVTGAASSAPATVGTQRIDVQTPDHVRQYNELMAMGATEEAQGVIKPFMEQFKAIGDVDKYGAADFYNANIAPIMGTQIEYSEPDDWTTPQQAIDEKTGQPTFFSRNKKTGEIEFVEGVKPMPKSGWMIESDGEGGFRMVQGDIGKGGWSQLTKPGATQTQKDIVALQDEYDRVMGIARQFDPTFLQVGTRLENKVRMFGEKVGIEIQKEDKEKIRRFVAWKRDSAEDLNLYIKRITGAQMGETEAQRLMLAKPIPGNGVFDGDSPTEYQAKLESSLRSLRLSKARREYLLQNGFTGDEIKKSMKADKPPISLREMEKIITDKAEQIYEQLKAADPQAQDTDLSRKAFEQAFRDYGA